MRCFGRVGAALLGVSALAACDSGGGSAPTPTTKIQIANPYQDQLRSLSVLNRSLGLRRAIQDGGQRCSRVTETGYQAPYKQLHMWVGRCAPEGDYAIFIAPTGDAQVRPCKDAAALGLPACKADGLETVPRITAKEVSS